MSIYQEIVEDLQSFHPDMSDYGPPIGINGWLNIKKFRYDVKEWAGSDTEEKRRKKISQTMRDKRLKPTPLTGASNPKARSVQCIQTGKIYGSLVECAKDNNVSVVTVRNWCKKEHDSTPNGQWRGVSFRYFD